MKLIKKSKGDDLFDDILKKNEEDFCVEKCEKNDVEAKFEFKINEKSIFINHCGFSCCQCVCN
jgi:hypothetical protein